MANSGNTIYRVSVIKRVYKALYFLNYLWKIYFILFKNTTVLLDHYSMSHGLPILNRYCKTRSTVLKLPPLGLLIMAWSHLPKTVNSWWCPINDIIIYIIGLDDTKRLSFHSNVVMLWIKIDDVFTFKKHKGTYNLKVVTRLSKLLSSDPRYLVINSFINCHCQYFHLAWRICGHVNNDRIEKNSEKILTIF